MGIERYRTLPRSSQGSLGSETFCRRGGGGGTNRPPVVTCDRYIHLHKKLIMYTGWRRPHCYCRQIPSFLVLRERVGWEAGSRAPTPTKQQASWSVVRPENRVLPVVAVRYGTIDNLIPWLRSSGVVFSLLPLTGLGYKSGLASSFPSQIPRLGFYSKNVCPSNGHGTRLCTVNYVSVRPPPTPCG